MLSRRRFLVLLGSASAAAGATALGVSLLPGDAEEHGSGPPSIRYGEESCATCGMVIADPRFAAAWRDASGRPGRFDDIGCMIQKLRAENPGAGTTLFVHDYGDESWLEALPATFVITPAIKTPMAYGIAAFASPEAARALATANGVEIVSWDAAVAAIGKAGAM